MSIAEIDALRHCHEDSLHLRVIEKVYVVVVIDIKRAASGGCIAATEQKAIRIISDLV